MGDKFLISRLKEKRAATADRIADLRREADRLQADLVHLDAVLQLYGFEPAEMPTKGPMPVRSAYFGRNEVSRRCRDMLREKGTMIVADQCSDPGQCDCIKNRVGPVSLSLFLCRVLHDQRPQSGQKAGQPVDAKIFFRAEDQASNSTRSDTVTEVSGDCSDAARFSGQCDDAFFPIIRNECEPRQLCAVYAH